jgi:small subunit ribosomal protein S21
MIKVRAKDREPVGVMIRRFKKFCEKEGLLKDLRRRSVYEKPSERRRRQRRRAELVRRYAQMSP